MQKISIKRITIGVFIGIAILIILGYLWSSVDISITFKDGKSLEEAKMILIKHSISQSSLDWGGGKEEGYYTVVHIHRILSLFVINKLKEDPGIEDVKRGKLFFLPPTL